MKENKPSLCHPDKRMYVTSGECQVCYRKKTVGTMATCHPSRKAHAHGLCRNCYQRARMKGQYGNRSKATCHPERKNKAGGLCPQCHQADKKRKKILGDLDFQYLLKRQDNKCAICLEDFSKTNSPCVDHDHKTGIVRGLLCRSCNLALGGFKDNPFVLHRAQSYIHWPPAQDLKVVS